MCIMLYRLESNFIRPLTWARDHVFLDSLPLTSLVILFLQNSSSTDLLPQYYYLSPFSPRKALNSDIFWFSGFKIYLHFVFFYLEN